tara:strand:- start:8098 stop:9327 length:1230 start_codon:yes stop_codon:yes gene_type:complete
MNLFYAIKLAVVYCMFWFNIVEIGTLKKTVEENGAFVIKLIQWYISRHDVEFNKKYDEFFDNICEHSFEETQEIIADLEEVEIERIPISSGCIGQVYKGTMDDKEIVLKIKHPNVKLLKNSFFFKLFRFIGNCFGLIDFKEFFESFNQQMNFKNEASNLLEFQEKFADNPHVIIPKVYKYSTDFIIMSYEESTPILSLQSEYKIFFHSVTLLLFIRECFIFHGIIHGDLHFGNWGIREETKSIVLYDFGFCIKLEKEDGQYFESFVDYFEQSNYTKMIECGMDNFTVPIPDDELKQKILAREECELVKSPELDIIRIIYNLRNIYNKYDLKLKGYIFSSFLTFGIVEKIINKHRCHESYKDNWKTYLSHCRTLKAFPKLMKIFEEKSEHLNGSFQINEEYDIKELIDFN